MTPLTHVALASSTRPRTLEQALARLQTAAQLSKNHMTQVVQGVFKALQMNLTKMQFGAAVPVVGTVIGAGVNARLLARIVDNAEHVYRKCFLRDKYGLASASDETDTSAESSLPSMSSASKTMTSLTMTTISAKPTAGMLCDCLAPHRLKAPEHGTRRASRTRPFVHV